MPPAPYSLEFNLIPSRAVVDTKNMHQVFRDAISAVVGSSARGDGKTTRVTLRAKEPIDPVAVAAAAAAQGWSVEFASGGEAKS